MVDKTLILRKLAEVDQFLSQIKEYAGISVEEYQSNWKTQRIVERTLQMMIETCVDIAGHIISDKRDTQNLGIRTQRTQVTQQTR